MINIDGLSPQDLGVALLAASDEDFCDTWSRLGPELQGGIPDAARSACYGRYRKLRPDIHASVERLSREQKARRGSQHQQDTNEGAAGDPVGAAWPEPHPIPEALPPVISFDCALLPDTLRPWIEDIAQRVQCPPDFPAVGAMIALAAVVGRKIGIRPKRRDDWLEVPNLWGGTHRQARCNEVAGIA